MSLLGTFGRVAKCYVLPVPFKREKLFPKLFQGLAISIVMQASAHVILGNILYPSISEKLVELGIDETTAKQLDTYPFGFVRPSQTDRTLADHLFSLTDGPTVFGMAAGLWGTMQRSAGYAFPYPVCDVSIPAHETFSARSHVSYRSGVPPEMIERIPLSDDQVLAKLLVHEIAHCDLSENTGLALYKTATFIARLFLPEIPDSLKLAEAEATQYAEFHSELAQIMASHNHDMTATPSDFMDFIIASVSIPTYYFWDKEHGYSHDLMLQLDATRYGTQMPATADIMSSRAEISEYVREKHIGVTEQFSIFLTKAMHDFVMDRKETASPFAIRRAELYLEAMNYFSPTLYAANIPVGIEITETVMLEQAPELTLPEPL